MIKTITCYVCDTCGTGSKPDPISTCPDLPDKWIYFYSSRPIHICPVCAKTIIKVVTKEPKAIYVLAINPPSLPETCFYFNDEAAAKKVLAAREAQGDRGHICKREVM
jgi:hypothetical protein